VQGRLPNGSRIVRETVAQPVRLCANEGQSRITAQTMISLAGGELEERDYAAFLRHHATATQLEGGRLKRTAIRDRPAPATIENPEFRFKSSRLQ
jgi:hypothetical protein